MIRRVSEFYSYLFQEEQGITVAYFKTKSGTEFRVYFYPIPEYFERLNSDTFLYRYGYFFGFTKLAKYEGKREAPDFRIRNTILNIIEEFFNEKGIDKVLLFYCDDEDGKKVKRSKCFDTWFEMAEMKTCFKKYDEEIIIKDIDGNLMDVEFLSLIIECENQNLELLLKEFQDFKEQLISNK